MFCPLTWVTEAHLLCGERRSCQWPPGLKDGGQLVSASPATGERDSGRDQNLRLNEAGATARAELGRGLGRPCTEASPRQVKAVTEEEESAGSGDLRGCGAHRRCCVDLFGRDFLAGGVGTLSGFRRGGGRGRGRSSCGCGRHLTSAAHLELSSGRREVPGTPGEDLPSARPSARRRSVSLLHVLSV